MSGAETALLILLSGMAGEQEEAAVESYREEEELAQYQFITAADDVVCDECHSFNGDIFNELEIEDLFDYEVITDEVLRANIHINCRCQLLRITAPAETIFPELM